MLWLDGIDIAIAKECRIGRRRVFIQQTYIGHAPYFLIRGIPVAGFPEAFCPILILNLYKGHLLHLAHLVRHPLHTGEKLFPLICLGV